jgi:hypothetical protein
MGGKDSLVKADPEFLPGTAPVTAQGLCTQLCIPAEWALSPHEKKGVLMADRHNILGDSQHGFHLPTHPPYIIPTH